MKCKQQPKSHACSNEPLPTHPETETHAEERVRGKDHHTFLKITFQLKIIIQLHFSAFENCVAV